jgi:hypothetical protein
MTTVAQGEVGLVFFVVLALCALLTARLVYRYDLYEHEPVPLLGVAVALGAGAMWLAGLVEAWLLAGGSTPGRFVRSVSTAASAVAARSKARSLSA